MNQSEFVDLIFPFQDKLFRLAKRMLVSREEAQDATQEVLVKLWCKNEQLDSYKSVEALAMVMTKNYCLDQLKSKRSTNINKIPGNLSDTGSGLEGQIDAADHLARIEKIIGVLPEKQQLVIQLREVEQYEFSEIAEITQLSETAVRVTLSRARKQIRKLMSETRF